MAYRLFRWLGLFFLSALTSLAAIGAPGRAPAVDAGKLRLAVSATLAPLAKDAQEAIRRDGGSLSFAVVGSETALEQLAEGQVDAALVARPLNDQERQNFSSRTIGHDALLLIVHERNRLEQIDEARVRAVFSRQIADWSQIGAGNGGAIVPVTRSLASGTRQVMDNAFGIGRVVTAGIVELGSNLAVVLYVAADPQAIGYVSAGAYEQARQRGLGIKALRLGGFTPSAQFCVGGHYPLCRPLLLVKRRHAATTRELARLEAALGGRSGEDLLTRHGFAPSAMR